HLANGAVTGSKLANGVAVRSINNISDNVLLEAGPNITIVPSGNALTIASTGVLSGVTHDATLAGNGGASSPLGITIPLSLNGAANATIDISNTSAAGAAVNASARNIGVSGAGGSVGVSGNGAFAGILAKGSDGTAFQGGLGVFATGGDSNAGSGGDGM